MDSFLITDEFVQATAWRRWGINMTKTGRQHWNSPCPQCGGTDRFYVTEHGYFQCNQCSYAGFLDDDQKNFKPDPLLLLKIAEQKKAEEERRRQRWEDWTNGFLAGAYWRDWHDKMNEQNRAWWKSQGITDFQIDFYELGYLATKQIITKEGDLYLPAYTIPIRDLDNWAEIVNIHYRLADPPAGIQKYRYEHGIPSREFYATPELHGKAVVVEGAKKSMVVFDRIDGLCQVIGLPGCTPSEDVMKRIAKDFDSVWLCLDPGCDQRKVRRDGKTEPSPEERFKKAVPQTRIVRLPDKPDDLFISGMQKEQFREYLRQAR